MKILQIVNKLCIGGMQRFVLDLSQELGVNNDVILLTLYNESYDQINVPNPNFTRIALNKKEGIDVSFFNKILKLIKKEKPEIIHTHMMSLLYVVPSIFLFPSQNIKYVHTIHNVADKEINQIDFIKRRLYGKKVCAVSISDKVYDSVKEYFNIDTPLIDNGASIPIVTDIGKKEVEDIFLKNNLNSDYPLLVTLGHISDSKNQILLNQAAKILFNKGYKFNVIIIGRDGEIEYANKLKQELSPNVLCIGESSNPGAWLKKADFFVMPSKYEGLPISLLEALSMKCIPICTPAGGIVNVIRDGDNGFLTNDFSVESFVDKLTEALLLSEDKRNQISEKGYQDYMNYYSMKTCAKKYEDLYKQLLIK